jgi:hypothetical protein
LQVLSHDQASTMKNSSTPALTGGFFGFAEMEKAGG